MLEKRGRFSVVFRNDSLKTKITLHCTLRILYISKKQVTYLLLETDTDFHSFDFYQIFWPEMLKNYKQRINVGECYLYSEK